MKLLSNSFTDGQAIPGEFAFCRPDSVSHICLADNVSPHMVWSDVPEATRSFVLLCHDPDAPSRPDAVNKEGCSVPADLPRMDFYHWILVDIPVTVTELATGADSNRITPRGKDQTPGPHGARRGSNSYTDWFAGDPAMAGNYFGYDGPCPPWNDSLPHHYHFSVYALDIGVCPIVGAFQGKDVLAAIEGHVLAQASITGLYSLNPDVPV